MTNEEIDRTVLHLIRTGLARTQAEITKSLQATAKANLDEMEISSRRTTDNSLKRLKSKSFVRFVSERKEWEEGTAPARADVHPDELDDTDDTSLSPKEKRELVFRMGQEFIDGPVRASQRPTVVPSAESAHGGETSLQSGNAAAQPPNVAEGTQTMSTASSTDVASIDSQIAAAKNAKGTTSKGTGTKRPRLTAEEKEARDKAREAEREQAKAKRESERAAKKAQREATRKPAHMSKVDKARAKLPALSEAGTAFFNDLTTNLSRDEVTALAAHLAHFNRTQATQRALSQKLGVGDKVKIISGDPRFVGQTGTVSKAQRIRCYVQVDAAKKPVYLFTSDVEIVSAAPAAKTA